MGEEGAGTVLVLAIVLGLIAVIVGVLLLVQATVGAARAGTAADLAALAGADTLRGLRTGDPCTVAGEVAGRNASELASCTTDLGDQTVTVHVQSRGGTFLPWPPSARARAGPPAG
ncbi:Rv3654c family TadE-like protein [Arthrobacter sp. 7Tela_A1]|uniref:Rv3654c family TadE-like protein n=1 Tax=Arthrobacter sp. 7Tela_A1 TaxID=3093745 RepID=UPI003BB55A69